MTSSVFWRDPPGRPGRQAESADVERALRAIPRPMGYELRVAGSHEEQQKAFDELLREESVVNTLGESVVHYFQVLFTDQRGWNIRNDVCHGISPPEAFSWPMTDRIFHALMILATVRESEGEQGPSTTEQ